MLLQAVSHTLVHVPIATHVSCYHHNTCSVIRDPIKLLVLAPFDTKFKLLENKEKLESHARVDCSGGCKSGVFNTGLGRVSPPLAGFLRKCQILVKMGGNSPHFMKIGWFCTIFSSVGWKWCFGGPGAQTPTKTMLFLCDLRGSGQEKCVSEWSVTKNAVPDAFLVEITKIGGITQNSAIFTKFQTCGCSRRLGPPRRRGICKYYKGFCKARRGQTNMWILHVLP